MHEFDINLRSYWLGYNGEKIIAQVEGTSNLISSRIVVDPTENWEGSHKGFTFRCGFDLKPLNTTYKNQSVKLLLRLCSSTTKTYISADQTYPLSNDLTHNMEIHIPKGTLSVGSEWYIELLISRPFHNAEKNLYFITETHTLFTKQGESFGSQLPIVLDSSINGLWEIRWKSTDLISAKELCLNYPAEDIYALVINNTYDEHTLLSNEPFDKKGNWKQLALEVYSHLFTEIILHVFKLVDFNNNLKPRSGSLHDFARQLCKIAKVPSGLLQPESQSHWKLFLHIREFLSRK